MGRRKIEIQPITHERNRSVTFLKRKNGLFKKAYELGVLCSVDVAVIIFEERPGHQRKLYQYCSTDVQSIVQQHLRHDGERDTRGPGDFSGASAVKMDDVGDGDEDDGEDDDEDLPSSATRKRARAEGVSIGKLRPSHDQDNMMHTDMDYNTRLSSHNHAAPSTFGIPPSIAHALSSHHTSHSSHPMSSDRLRPVPQFQNKKTKLDIHEHGRGHSHPEDPSPVSGGNDYTFPAPSSSSFRHPQHPSSPSSASSLHQVSYGNPQYTQSGFFSNTPTQSVPPSSYMHSQGDMTSSRGRSYTSPAGSTAYSPQSRPRPATASGSGGSTGDLLVAYLDDPSGARRTSSAGTGASGPGGPSPGAFAIDWPGPPTNNATGSPSTATSANSAQAGSHWLDFLSGNGNQPPPSTQGHSQSHSATSTPVPSSISHANVNPQKHSSSQSMSGWPSQSRSQAGASPTGRNSGVRRSTSGGDGSGAGVSLDVDQLFGAGASRGGEVKKEG